MNIRTLILILAAAAVLAAQMNDADVLLQRAIRKESVEGDLKGAIDLYKKVIAAAGRNRVAAAKALLRLGECYEKQGNTEAQRAYERLVREFSDQKQQALDAEARLTAMGQTAGSKTMTAQLIFGASDNNLEGSTTPDGRLFLFVDWNSGDIAARDFRTGTVRRLMKGTWNESGTTGGDIPIPSADGKQVAFVWYPGYGQWELRVANVDGTDMRTLPIRNKPDYVNQVAGWSPDGKRLLVDWSIREPWSRKFATIDVATGEVHQIGNANGNNDVAGFSADGRWIVFARQLQNDSSDWDIFALDPKTGHETIVVTGAGADRAPVWVPEKDILVFRSDRNGENGIWMVRFQDGQAAGSPVLIKPDAGDYFPAGMSRDGSLFYQLWYRSNNVYEARVDPQTLHVQETPRLALENYLGRNSLPVWSPSGQSFAYNSFRENKTRLIVHAPDRKEIMMSEPVRSSEAHWCGSGDRLTSRPMGSAPIQFFDARSGVPSPPEQIIKYTSSSFSLGLSRDCASIYVSNYSSETKQRRISRYDVPTGTETLIAQDAGEPARSPVLSPDGRWLALHGKLEGGKDSGLLVVSTAGGPLRMLDRETLWRHAWTPDSKRLMYAKTVKQPNGKGTENELYWVPVEGGAPQPMGIRMPGVEVPSLSPDGTRLLFSAGESSSELWVLRNLPLNQKPPQPVHLSVKAPAEELITKGRTDTFNGRVTPDGRLLPFVDHVTGDIFVRDLRTGESRRVTNDGGKWRPEEFGGDSPIPSRDGKQLAYAWYVRDHAVELRVVNLDGSARRTVPMKPHASIAPADWSPDGKSVVAVLQEDGPGSSAVAVVNLATGEQHQLLSCGDPASQTYKCRQVYIAGFSPDAQWVVYHRQVGDNNSDLFAMNRRTGEETVLVKGTAWNGNPVWEPGTDRILFRSDRNGKNSIYRVRFQSGWASGAPELVSHDSGKGRVQGLSRDGSFFYGVGQWMNEVYEAAFDPQTRRVVGVPKLAINARQPAPWFPSWAPDGSSWAYFRIPDRVEPNQPSTGSLVIRKADGAEVVAARDITPAELPRWCRADGRTYVYSRTVPPFQRFDAETGVVVPPAPHLLDHKPPVNQWGYAFSPDCQSVYFLTYSNKRRIYKVNVATGSETELLSDDGRTGESGPYVSPDGRWLAFRGDMPGKRGGILVLPTDGGPLRMLFEAAGDNFRDRTGIAWTPDSKYVIFVQQRWPRPSELYSVPVEGGASQSTGIYDSSGVAIHPDGKRILLSLGNPIEEIWALRNLPLN